MKILHVLSDSNIGGAGVLLLSCLRHFNKDRYEIKVVLPENAELSPMVSALGFEVIETKNGRDASYEKAATAEFVEIFKREKPDIVHTHSSLSARIAARKNRVPLVFQTHHCAVMPPKYKRVFPIKQILGAINNHYSDRIIATAEIAADILLMQGTKRDKISVIINGAEPKREISDAEKKALLSELGLGEENFIFSMVARLEEVKDHRTFILAAAETLHSHPEMRFLIVGKGSLSESLASLANDLGIEDKIIFTGFCEDTAPYMNIAHVNVNCSFSETSCLAISEGMSLSMPTIVSDCEGNMAMIENGEDGLVFERGNSEMLATAMITLCENDALREKMSKKARESFESRFDAAVMTKKLEELYDMEYEKRKK